MDWSLVVIYVSSAVAVVAVAHSLSAAKADTRLRHLERNVRLIMEHLGVQTSAEHALARHGRRIDALLREGRKIQAIKVYREVTGVGLKEAKDAVDNLDGASR